MHSPQETQDDSPIGKLLSKAMPAWYPLPRRASTQLWRISLQPRMQRSQRMHASWSTSMANEESSCPRGVEREGKRDCPIPDSVARRSNSQSPECCSRAHGEGWSDISSSTRVRLTPKTPSVFVLTVMPCSAWRRHEAA